MSSLKYVIQKYTDSATTDNWVKFGDDIIINDDTQTPYAIEMPENKSYRDINVQLRIQEYGDTGGCNASGETIVVIPSGETCFCTCANIDMFFYLYENTFPNVLIENGVPVETKTFLVMSGYTQQCGDLSATTDSEMFDGPVTIFKDENDRYYFYVNVIAQEYSATSRSGAVRVYFKSKYPGGGDYSNCYYDVTFTQKQIDPEDQLSCVDISGITRVWVHQLAIPYDRAYFEMPSSCQHPIRGTIYIPAFSYSMRDNFGWLKSGVLNTGYGGPAVFNVGINTSQTEERRITLQAIPYITAGIIEEGDETRIVSGTPCPEYRLYVNVIQGTRPPCTCDEHGNYGGGKEFQCDYSTTAQTGDKLGLVYDSLCWEYDPSSLSISCSTETDWMGVIGAQYISQGLYKGDFLLYDVYDRPNDTEDDWGAIVYLTFNGVGNNIGNSCTFYYSFTKVKGEACGAPTGCSCSDILSNVDKTIYIPATGGTSYAGKSSTQCGQEISELKHLGWDSGPEDWIICTTATGQSLAFSASSNENSSSSRTIIAKAKLKQTGGTCSEEELAYNITIIQRAGCSCASTLKWGDSSNCNMATQVTSIALKNEYTSYGKYYPICGGDCATRISLDSKPDWIDIDYNDKYLYVRANSNAGTQSGLSGTIKFKLDGDACSQLDLAVTYDYECDCQGAMLPMVETEGYTSSIPASGGTFQVAKITNYDDFQKAPCLDIKVSSTSEGQGTLESVSVDSAGVVSVTTSAYTGSSVLPMTIDFNVYNDSTPCGSSYFTNIIIQVMPS